tara:strand:+ start:432 stop:671 length:240 start_codon:yes stop_codon:yes gene_type:complete
LWGRLISPSLLKGNKMTKVKCIKDVSLGSLGMDFTAGEEYDIPAKDANAYSEYFEKKATPKAKKADVEEDKQSTTEENK